MFAPVRCCFDVMLLLFASLFALSVHRKNNEGSPDATESLGASSISVMPLTEALYMLCPLFIHYPNRSQIKLNT